MKGDGRVVGVVGEAGIGKSRLCFEFAESCRQKGIRVYEARVLAHGRATPFQPVLELMRDYFGIRGKEPAEVSRRRVLDRLAALPISEQLSSILLEFLGLADPQRAAIKLDPKTRKTQLLDFVRTLPRSPRDPTSVVIVEDLHWIDAASEEFVEALADAVVGTTTLLVVNLRPVFTAPLMQRSHYRQINIPPLPPAQAAILVQDHFGNDPSLALLSRNIIERAQGNPFFLEELINALVERGDFEGEKGAYRLKGGIDSIPLPSTGQAVVAARIDRLEESAKKVLEIASVVGREISTSILDAVAGLAPAELSAAAQHLEQAGENLKAAQQNMRAAVWIGTNDPSQALRSWKKVRELLSDLPPSQPINYLKMMASGQIVNFAWREGISAKDALVYFEEAKQLALALGDIRANALIHAAYGRMLANGGSADEYVEKIREAKAIADEGNDPSVQITLKAVLCHALWLSGRMREALQMNVEATERAHEIVKFDRQTLGFDIEVWLTVLRGRTLVMLDRKEEARPFLDRILQLESSQVDPVHHVMPSMAYVDIAWAQENLGLAREHADRAFAIAIKSGNPYLRVYAQASRGLSHIVAGRLTSAIEDLSEAMRFARSRKAGLENEPRILADLANAYRLNGDTENALSAVTEAIKVAIDRNARVPECLARIVHAQLLLSGTSDQKIAGNLELERAQALMQETGAIIFKAMIAPSGDELPDTQTSVKAY